MLLAWNALFLQTLVEAAAAFDRHDWMHAAHENVAFLLASMRRDDGRAAALVAGRPRRASSRSPRTTPRCVEALLTLAELDDVEWLREARHVADEMLALFADDEQGGVFTTGSDAEALIVRPEGLPGQRDAVGELARRERACCGSRALTGETRYADAARRWLGALAPVLADHPTAFAYLLGALDRAVHPSIEVAVVGDPTDPAATRPHPRGRGPRRSRERAAECGAERRRRAVTAAAAPRPDRRPADRVRVPRLRLRLPVTEPTALRAQLDAGAAERLRR